MQHHIDEFSVTDIRHTLHEVWRVVVDRRWFFILPFCIVSTLAFVGSLWVPRQYTADTIVKREHDPVFASLGKSWKQPYDQIRERMAGDLTDRDSVMQTLEELDLPPQLPRFENGELTPKGTAARERFAEQVAAGLSVKAIEASRNRDIVSIRLTLPDPTHIPDILRHLRDQYIASARRRTVGILQSVKAFFKAESERCSAELAALHKRLVEYELKYPGVNPDLPDPTQTEESALVVERIELERKVDEWSLERAHLEELLSGLCGSESGAPLVDSHMLRTEPEPRYVELQREIEEIQRGITDGKTLRFMTEQHPVIRRLRARLAASRAELARTPKTRTVVIPLEDEEEAIEQVEGRLAEIDRKLAGCKGRLAKLEEQSTQLARRRASVAEHRQAYLKLRRESNQLQAELNTWQKNISPIEHVLVVEGKDRTIHFATVRDVEPIVKPSSPDGRFVLLVCLVIGAAAGAVTALLAELLDHSYRTVKQISTSLGIPVIESIDEIVVQATRRKRLLRSLVLLPVATFMLAAVMLLTGAMAYLSIENPSGYEALKSSPQRVYRMILG